MTDARQRAFLELLEPVYDRLSRYALAVTKNEMDGEDLTSATVLAAYEAFEKYTNDAPFLHYLLKIASRLNKRQRFRERKRVPFDEEQALLQKDGGTSPETAAEIRIVMDALQTLPEKMRETVVLFDISDLSLEEIHRLQGGSLSGVKSRLKRGRERLAQTLGVESPVQKASQQESTPPAATEHELPFLLTMEERYV
ncbi:MAG TPA: RNA polymerase sigma factor [Candidatus Kapabacteria bacterium]|jgi:RNA polymerase sigma-70 factor (ECF subfamily)